MKDTAQAWPSRKASKLTLALILILAPVLIRISLFSSPTVGLWSPLDRDAAQYLNVAHALLTNHVRESGFVRGPFFSLIVALLIVAFSNGAVVIKLTSFAFGILTTVATYLVARKILGSALIGGISAFLVGTANYVVFNALRGLREELSSLIILALIYFTFVRTRHSKLNLAMSGALVGLLYLTRSDDGIIVTISLLVYIASCAARGRMPAAARKIFAVVAGFGVSVLMWAVSSLWLWGDPFHESNYMASYMYWFELQHATGLRSVQVTILDYIFKYHTSHQLLSAAAAGFLSILQFVELSAYPYWFGYPLWASPTALLLLPTVPAIFLYGMWSMIRSRNNWYFPFSCLAFVPYVSTFFGLGVFEIPRLMLPFMPELFVTLAFGLIVIWKVVSSRLRRPFVDSVKCVVLPALLYAYFHVNYMYLLAWARLTPIGFGYFPNTLVDSVVLVFFGGLCVLWGWCNAIVASGIRGGSSPSRTDVDPCS